MEIKTNCLECVFSNHGKCKLGRYKNFEKNGATIEVNQDGSRTVQGRYCSALRKQHWADENKKTKFNLEVILRHELLISTEVFIYIDKENYSENNLVKTLFHLNNQLLKPNLVVFVVNDDDFKFARLIKLGNDSGLNFRVDRILTNEVGVKMHQLDALDIAARKSVGDFILLMHPGATVEDNEFFANIDEAINDKLIRFSVVLPNPDNGRGIMVSTPLYKKLDGNHEMTTSFIDPEGGNKETVLDTMEAKIKYLVNKHHHESFLKTYEEIKNG